MRVSVVNLGVNNIKSVMGALEHIGQAAHVAAEPRELEAICLIPGIGNFGFVSEVMRKSGWMDAIRSHAQRGRPVIGICLGMQLLCRSSAEAPDSAGLDLLPDAVLDLRSLPVGGERLPVTGWRKLESEVPAWNGLNMYFNHSYGIAADHPHCLASYRYGAARIAAVVGRDNILGLQFHPEKSGLQGLKLLENCIDHVSGEGV
ncbi:imidazole glycerol phosphate synthase subunit HisH [uncultured Ramlibacter sp.]|uniref:imidazole glycerol phosphate synthase subunit HisH n=1 Tax=uncultured Ramlibacter sp. TaxID=260755 RepID=UPI00260F0B74|nr:imidazole glycerol phosphate synthase subunit HisH [uncultured Ramlibacter sp.]